MLDLRSFVVSECKAYKCMKYFGENHYYIYDSGKTFTLVVVELYNDGTEKEEKVTKYSCGSLSSAIASIEALENGEEI